MLRALVQVFVISNYLAILALFSQPYYSSECGRLNFKFCLKESWKCLCFVVGLLSGATAKARPGGSRSSAAKTPYSSLRSVASTSTEGNSSVFSWPILIYSSSLYWIAFFPVIKSLIDPGDYCGTLDRFGQEICSGSMTMWSPCLSSWWDVALSRVTWNARRIGRLKPCELNKFVNPFKAHSFCINFYLLRHLLWNRVSNFFCFYDFLNWLLFKEHYNLDVEVHS